MRSTVLAAAIALLAVLTACTSTSNGAPTASPTPSPSPSSTPTPAPSTPSATKTSGTSSSTKRTQPTQPTRSTKPTQSATTPAPVGRVEQVFASMTDAQRVGQLLMVDCPSTGVRSATVTAIRTYHVGSVILDGNSTLSISRQHDVTRALQAEAPAHTKLFISTDQEGGLVRRMRGPGFSDIPSAVVQGGYAPSALQADAKTWAGQLAAAGLNVDLAPVLDTVPPGSTSNPPIGDLDREYGHDPSTVTAHGTAVARGFAAAGVVATVKHFPGLGRVTSNTDTTSGVTDTITTSTDPYLRPFAAAIKGGVPFVMMSTAIYTKIDSRGPAAFSPRIVTGLLRGTLGFHGVVISDDVGAAKQVSGYPVGERAWRFIRAGGDIVLTVDASQAAAMTAAILNRMKSNATFKTKVYASVRRVLQAKDSHHLLD